MLSLETKSAQLSDEENARLDSIQASQEETIGRLTAGGMGLTPAINRALELFAPTNTIDDCIKVLHAVEEIQYQLGGLNIEHWVLRRLAEEKMYLLNKFHGGSYEDDDDLYEEPRMEDYRPDWRDAPSD